MERKLIDQYESGGGLLAQAIAGIAPADLDWHPPADVGLGQWSIRQIVVHLMDSDLVWTERMKRIIAENNPRLVSYDESTFAQALSYDQQDPARAAAIFGLNRRQFAAVLRPLDDSAFTRSGSHSEMGAIDLEFCVSCLVKHLDHHLQFVHRKLAHRHSTRPVK